MRILTVLAAVACLAAAAPAGAAPAATPAAAVDKAEVARRAALVERLLEVTEFDATLAKTFDAALPAVVERYFPSLSAAEKAEMLGLVRDAVDDLMPDYKKTIIDIYSELFTEAELQAMIAFYGSAEGRSINAKTPLMAQREQEALTRLAPAINEAVRRRGCERFGCGEQAPRT